jgi:Holliday junction resolvase RusA-like endonuclease
VLAGGATGEPTTLARNATAKLKELERQYYEARQPTGPMHITLPVAPSANRYWRQTLQGDHPYVSEEAKAYKRLVLNLCLVEGITSPFVGPVILTIEFYRALASGDLSNRIKVLEDAIEGIFYLDDKQVVELHARRHDDPDNPRIEVTVAHAEWAVQEEKEFHDRQAQRRREQSTARRRGRQHNASSG